MSLHLVPEAKHPFSLASVQVSTVIAVLGVADQFLPIVQSFVSPWMFGVLGVASAVARLVAQDKVTAQVRREQSIK